MTDLLVLHFAPQVSKSYQLFSGTSKNCVTFTRLPEKLRKIGNFDGILNRRKRRTGTCQNPEGYGDLRNIHR